jgi:hypothetical protein
VALPLRGTAKFAGAADGLDITLTFDGGGSAPQTGDIVFLFGGRGNSSDAQAFGPITAGYTACPMAAGANPIDSTGPKFGVWYKVMGGTPDTSVQGEGGGNGVHGVAYGAFVLDGSLVDPAIFDVNGQSTGQVTQVPNAPSITTVNPGWVIAFAASGTRDTTHGTVSGYTSIAGGESTNETDDIGIEAWYIEKLTPGAEDPPAWSAWSSGLGGGITIAIRQAVVITSIEIPTGELLLTGFAPIIPKILAPGTGQLLLEGFAPSLPKIVATGTGQLLLEGFAPTLTIPTIVTIPTGDLVVTGFAPSIPKILLIPTGELTLTGFAPSIPKIIAPGTGQLLLTGFAPSIPKIVQPGTGALLLTGFAPSIPKIIAPGTGQLLLEGYPPEIVTLEPTFIVIPTGELVLEGFAPSIGPADPVFITIPTGFLVLTGFAPTLFSGTPAPVTPAAPVAFRRELDGFIVRVDYR